MRTLVLMRGAMGSGKSTTIKNAGLEQYTLSADDYRLKVLSPTLNENGNFHISNNRDKLAWDSLKRDLETRMKDGHFTIVDATHSHTKLINAYNTLANRYDYKVFIYEMDTPLEVCIERNAQRDEYKRVPEEAIHRSYNLIKNVEPSRDFTKISSFDEVLNIEPVDITDKFDKVKIIGDVHGCYTVLQDAVTEIDNERVLHIFLGDYCDRGAEERETLEWFINNCQRKNVVFLEGNHDNNLRVWSKDYPREELTKVFKYTTLPEIMKEFNNLHNTSIFDALTTLRNKVEEFEGLLTDEDWKEMLASNKTRIREVAKEEYQTFVKAKQKKESEYQKLLKQVRVFVHRFRQFYAFRFNGVKFLCTHGGLTSVPNLPLIPTRQFIRGVGDYETDVAGIYKANSDKGKCQDYTQVHGHRKVTTNKKSYSLEDGVEFGGSLATLEIDRFLDHSGIIIKRINYKNTVFKEVNLEDLQKDSEGAKTLFEDEELNQLINSKFVEVKRLQDGVSSVVFQERVFKKSIWNDLTVKARGLFIDESTGKIIARGYNKTFNYGQVKVTEKRSLKNTLAFPVKAYEKYNGFLGILTRRNGEWFICSKSTNEGPFAKMFKDALMSESKEVLDRLAKVIDENNCSLLFEVCHPNDKHMVDYQDKTHLFLLDAVPNSLDVSERNPDNKFVSIDPIFSKQVIDSLELDNLETKYIQRKALMKDDLNSMEEIEKYMTYLDNSCNLNLEGVMFEDQNGFVFKFKTKAYKNWKHRRGLLHKFISHCVVRKGQRFPMEMTHDKTDVLFVNFLFALPKEAFEKEYDENGNRINDNSIVKFRNMFYEYITKDNGAKIIS